MNNENSGSANAGDAPLALHDFRVILCDRALPGVGVMTVDDFHDPDGREVPRDDIHVTLWRGREPGGDAVTCLRLPVASARRLVLALLVAADERDGGGA
jgi:hypothetical protein